ncbi:TRAP transporter small permease [Acuticoccus mangrovi]|uniref:TRAP transporter small permease protein n=1 Tax=Acuticoccus mangrovi TaxID=2796142 RepID=A0A934IK47_9HYPH|nr:TRAP transporter small permease subunit [Acuticoccus mangrovi]MBJ3777963.1 TRAP transporter small permease [Acuticoccus mangrovi]
MGVLAGIDTGARLLVIVCVAVMVTVVSAQVGMRYLLNSSIDWAQEVSRFAFVATVFLAIPLGLRDRAHVGIDILVSRFPAALRDALARALALLAAAMLLVVFATAIRVAGATWSERLGSLDITSSVFFMPVIVSALHTALHLIAEALWPRDTAALVPPEGDGVLEQPS